MRRGHIARELQGWGGKDFIPQRKGFGRVWARFGEEPEWLPGGTKDFGSLPKAFGPKQWRFDPVAEGFGRTPGGFDHAPKSLRSKSKRFPALPKRFIHQPERFVFHPKRSHLSKTPGFQSTRLSSLHF